MNVRYQLVVVLFLFVYSLKINAIENDSLAWVNMDSLLMPLDTLRNDNSIAVYETPEIKFPEVTPKSPEASAFMKYGSGEINEYTGNPAISVPLYTLSYKGIDIPINLTYDGDGVQVAQEASWVGLGWNLNVGGCINYVSQGGNDQWLGRHGSWDNDYYRILNSNPAPHFKMDSNFAELDFAYDSEADNIHEMLVDLKNGESEWDFYSANILGHSFLFFKNPYTDKYVMIGPSNEVFEIKELPNNEWEFIDVNGVIYTFSEKEYSKESSWGSFVSAWYLTQIQIPSGGYIYFDYSKSYSYSLLPHYSQSYDFIENYSILQATTVAGFPNAGVKSRISGGVWGIDKKYLSSIETDDQTMKVDFSLSDRIDLPGARRLSALSLKSPLSGKTIKEFKFNYSYFNSCLKGGNYLAFPQKENYSQEDLKGFNNQLKYRLKLLSVSELDNALADSLTTSFEYYETADKYSIGGLPLKTSCAIDFWGYYNGQENKNAYRSNGNDIGICNGLMPKPSDCYIGNLDKLNADILKLQGANRFSDEKFMKIGTLHKITYPTKGYVVYDFEPHHFSSKVMLPAATSVEVAGATYSVADINFVADGSHPGTGPDTQKQFQVSEDSWGELKITVQARSESEFRKMASLECALHLIKTGSTPVVKKFNMNSLNIDYSKLRFETTIYKMDLPSGNYILVADLPSGLGKWDFQSYPNYIGGKLTVKPKKTGSSVAQLESEIVSIGAGLRLSSLSHFKSDGSLVDKVVYEYNLDNGKSSGKSLIPALLVQKRSNLWVTSESLVTYDVLRFSSDLFGNSSYTSSVSKGRVGYSCVKKNVYDKNNSLVSFTISTYVNEPAKAIFNDYFQFVDFTNGNLLSCKSYSAKGKLCSEVANTYRRETGHFYKCNSFLENRVYGDLRAFKSGLMRPEFFKLYQLTVYSYYSYWNSLAQTVHTTYGDNGNIVQTQTYEYNRNNHLVSKETFYNNKDNVKCKTEYLYPGDIDDGIEGAMQARHYLSPVLCQRNYQNDKLALSKLKTFTSVKTAYSLHPLLLLNKEQYAVGTATPEVRMEYEYNLLGNIQCVMKDKSEKVTYLWSYNNGYPVMEIQGASYAEVVDWIGSSVISVLQRKKTPSYLDLIAIKSKLDAHSVLCKCFIYNPGIGVVQMIDSNGYSTYYNYDSFNRLKTICNHEGKVIQEYSYNYKK